MVTNVLANSSNTNTDTKMKKSNVVTMLAHGREISASVTQCSQDNMSQRKTYSTSSTTCSGPLMTVVRCGTPRTTPTPAHVVRCGTPRTTP